MDQLWGGFVGGSHELCRRALLRGLPRGRADPGRRDVGENRQPKRHPFEASNKQEGGVLLLREDQKLF